MYSRKDTINFDRLKLCGYYINKTTSRPYYPIDQILWIKKNQRLVASQSKEKS